MYVEKEGEARREFIDLHTAFQRGIHIGQSIGNGKRQFLYGRCPRLANMVATDANRIPARHIARAKLDGIGHQAQRGLRREQELFLRAVLLEYVVLQRATERSHREAALLRVDDVHGPDHRRGTIDRHRGRNLIQRQAVEQHLHVGQRGDRHAALTKFTRRQLVIRVIAVQRRHIKSRREARLTLREQVLETLVGIFRRAKAREHAHRPGLGAVHRRLHAARIGILPGQPHIPVVVKPLVILRRIHAIDRHPRSCNQIISFWQTLLRLAHRCLFPLLSLRFQLLQRLFIK